MKKILLSVVLLSVISLTAFAQTRFGVTAGVSLAKTIYKTSGFSVSPSSFTTFHAGVLADMALSEDIYFQPQLLLSGKGLKISEEGYKTSANPFYLELPLNFLYKASLGTGKIYGGVGPYVAYGLFGKYKSNIDDDANRNIKFGSGIDADYKSFDFGGNVIVGYEFENGLFLNANYSFGLSNVAASADDGEFGDNSKVKNNYFGISIGFLFGGNSNY